jgi:DNA-binding NtrC family response regulator
MTAYASTESAIQALKYGAFDYLQKPFKVDELMQALRRGMEFKRTIAERESVTAAAAVKPGDFEARFVGSSPKIKRLISQLKKLASAHTPILISGELGSGHEIAAELLHSAGTPADSPLVRIDCRLSSMESLRAGLLGQNGSGGTWVQQAKGGTLFLLHLQSLLKEAQAELVSVLRNNAHNFRLVCATEEDLEKLSEQGQFNEELFYRVAVLPVQLPPLRDRLEDIPLLLKDIAAKTSNPEFDVRQIEFTEDALATLRAYRWPGNLAEFRQMISQIITTTETRVVTSAQLPLRVHELKDWPTLEEYLIGQEKQYIARVLHACQGDKGRAAEALRIDVSHFG